MKSNIHPTAIISSKAHIDNQAVVGPYCVIGDNVLLHKGVELISHVSIGKNTEIGEGTKVYPYAVLGFKPQDLKFSDEETKVVIGKNNQIREHVTIHLATANNPSLATTIGDNCLFMGSVHIAHDCKVANNVIIAQGSILGGHTQIDENAIIGGASATHQFSHVGQNAFIAGGSIVTENIIPFAMYTGSRETATIHGINILGLKRKGYSLKDISDINTAYNIIFNRNFSIKEKIEELNKLNSSKPISILINFLKSNIGGRILCLNYKKSNPKE